MSLDIICSLKLTVSFSEQIMSAEEYPSTFSCQMEAIVYVIALTQQKMCLLVWTRVIVIICVFSFLALDKEENMELM